MMDAATLKKLVKEYPVCTDRVHSAPGIVSWKQKGIFVAWKDGCWRIYSF